MPFILCGRSIHADAEHNTGVTWATNFACIIWEMAVDVRGYREWKILAKPGLFERFIAILIDD